MNTGTMRRSSAWPVAGLLLLSALPLSFGAIRMLQFAGIVDVMPPVSGGLWFAIPIILHIGGAAIYAILGAFQFSAAIRQRWPSWHRRAGRVSLAAALVVALSALWLTFNYATTTLAGMLLAGLRVTFAAGLLLALAMGLAAIRQRNFQRHREWMIRAYALALGSATQMIVLMLAEMVMARAPNEFEHSALMGLAWGLNLVFAEWLIRGARSSGGRRSHDRRRTWNDRGAT